MDVGLGDELSKKLEALEPLVQGHMFKQTSLRRSFVKRYFVLFEGVLLYYSHERDYKTDRRHGLVSWRILLYRSSSEPVTDYLYTAVEF